MRSRTTSIASAVSGALRGGSHCPSVYHIVPLSVCLSQCPSVCPSHCPPVPLSHCPSITLSLCPFAYHSVFLSVYRIVPLSVCLSHGFSVHLSHCPLSVFLSHCPSVHLSITLSLCPSFYYIVPLSVYHIVPLSVFLSHCPLSVYHIVPLSVFLSHCPSVRLSIGSAGRSSVASLLVMSSMSGFVLCLWSCPQYLVLSTICMVFRLCLVLPSMSCFVF